MPLADRRSKSLLPRKKNRRDCISTESLSTMPASIHRWSTDFVTQDTICDCLHRHNTHGLPWDRNENAMAMPATLRLRDEAAKAKERTQAYCKTMSWHADAGGHAEARGQAVDCGASTTFGELEVCCVNKTSIEQSSYDPRKMEKSV